VIIIFNTMKCLLVFLLILGVYCYCRDDQYDIDELCVDCRYSPCKECWGDDICDGCKPGLNPYYGCMRCSNVNRIPINWKCVECSDLGASPTGDGLSCYCTTYDTNYCCYEDEGVFLDYYGVCMPCSYEIVGCERCTFQSDGYLTCLRCGFGFEKVIEDRREVCFPYEPTYFRGKAAHLLTLGGLLISLLILL